MSNLAPMPPVSASETYRPMNALSVVGMLFGFLSLLIFVYDAPWMSFLLPFPGFLLSLIAYRQIRGSDGTQTGLRFATTGLVLSIISSLGFWTMNITANLIIRTESAAFLDQWLQKCLKGKSGESFLDCVAPDQRSVTFRLDDIAALRRHFPHPVGAGSYYDGFRQEFFPSQLLRYQERAELTEPGIIDAIYEKEVWTVRHRRNLSTPELNCGVVITVKSQMIPGPRRGWKIELALTHPAPNTMRVTPYGQEMRDAVKDAGKALDRTLREVTDGRRTESLKLLKNSQDKTLVDGWDNFYKSLRREADSESAHLDMIMNQPILLKDNQNGKGWRLETTGGVEAKNREVEYRVVMETDDIRNGPPGWRMLECTLLGERKKVGPAILSTSSPSVPSPDAKPEPK